VLRSDGEYDDTVEHSLAQLVEAPGLKALQLLKEGATVPSWHERVKIGLLFAIQYLRIPRTVDQTRDALSTLGTLAARGLFSHSEFVLRTARQAGIAIQDARQVQEIRDNLVAGGLQVEAQPSFAMGMALMPAQEICALLMARDWTVYMREDPVFYASDSPVYISPSTLPPNGVVGLANEDIAVSVPISSRRFLMMNGLGRYDKMMSAAQEILPAKFLDEVASLPPVVRYMSATDQDVQRLNRETCEMAGVFVCGPGESIEIERYLAIPPFRFQVSVEQAGDLITSQNRYVRETRE
jgi:hypothetical protein